MFGNGAQALYYEESAPYVDRDGKTVQDILLVPSKELRAVHHLTDKDLTIQTEDGYRGIWGTYPTKLIRWIKTSKTGSVVLIACAYDGKRTVLMDWFDEALDLSVNHDIKENRLRAYISTLQRELEDAYNQQGNLLQKQKEYQDIMKQKAADEGYPEQPSQ